MEEDDEFGDLYTDVLTPFTNSSSLPIQNTGSIHGDRKESVVGAPNLKQFDADNSDSHRGLSQIKLEESKWTARVLEGDSKVNLPERRVFEDPNSVDESQINVIVDEGLEGNTENFDIEGLDDGIGDSVIPGLSIPGLSIPGVSGSAINGKDADFGEGDDWDSDSDDDLQIVLNDNNHGPMSMGRLVGPDGNDADEDGDPLVIVADSDNNHQQMEEQEWREDAVAAQGGDVERKDLGDGSIKVNGVVPPPKTGYGYHHQYHLQFKYVRPGAPPIPGAAPLPPGVPPGQIRPPLGAGPTTGRGRGDWRPAGMQNAPPIQKGFHAGYGMPVWVNNTPGHGFGKGLDFTLPSHKTIFEIDIDSFEEKPWRLPGIDISDYFNFGLNEDSWKDYCKQLEQLRLEATMQSKIRVYESGRTEQDYDPDMPPELAAAAGVRDIPSDNANLGKEVGQSDIATASMHSRPQLPTGRAIQVEAGYGERLPSIDTRPTRMRDADAIIEIVLQDSADDDSVNGNDIAELPEDTSREGLRGGHAIEEDNAQEDTELLDGASQAYSDQKRELARRKSPLNKPVHDGTIEGDGNSPIMLDASVQNPSISGERTPVYPGLRRDERRMKGRVHDRSPSKTRTGSTHDKRHRDFHKDETAESNGKGPHVSSRHTGGIIEDQFFEERDSDQKDGRSETGKPEIDRNMADIHKDENPTQSIKKQKLGSQVEQPSLEEVDDEEESKAARSSENSKAISGSRDCRNLQDGAEDEVVQHGRSTHMGIKRKHNEVEYRPRSRGHEERHDMDRHHMVIKEREDSHYRKNWDSNMTHHSHLKTEVIDQRKGSDNIDGAWQRRDEESHGKKTRSEDTRKRDRGDEMGPRHRTKVRDVERNDIDQYQHRKQLDNGSWRSQYDNDMGSHHRARDDNLKARVDNLDDLNSKQRKEKVHLKREHGEKEDLLHGSRQKRERDDIMEHRKRDELTRIRNDDLQSVRHKEDIWFQRDRMDRQRERDDWQRLKQPHEENLPKREREDMRGVKTGRASEEKSWASHSRSKDELKGSDREYHLKDPARHGEQLKRCDRLENESLSRHRGSEEVYSRARQPINDERRSRHERASGRNDRAINASDYHKVPEKKHKAYPRKSKDPEGNHSSAVTSRRNQDHDNQISDRVRLRGMITIERGSGDPVIPVSRQSSKRHKEDASSDDEQHDSKKGRSKLERWTSHKERDFNAGIRSSSSVNVKEISDQKKVVTLLTDAFPDESSKALETVQKPLANEIDAGDQANKNVEVKPKEDKHLDTVEKLKKRSERFKLPMPSEKEPVTVKKMENEQLPPVQSESCTNLEIKQERPARKRRWTGN